MRPSRPPTRAAERGRIPGVAQRLQRAWLSRGPAACLLWPLSLLMGGLVWLRRMLYRSGLVRCPALPVPVLVVGNLVVGGAGKTPTVLALVTLLRAQGHRVGIVSRGHGRRGAAPQAVQPGTAVSDAGDEPLLLRLRGQVPVWVGRDRVAAAQALLAAHPDTTVIVSDDGLQHLRLARQLQLVVFDERGVGNGWLLPAGPLREPLPPGKHWPADDVPTQVVYNAPAPSTPLAGSLLQTRLSGAVALVDWWTGEAARSETLEALRGRPVLAAAGTARPQRFFSMLRAAGLDCAELPLPDHHPYADLPWPPHTADVVLTEKDAVKLDPLRLGSTRVWVVPLDLQFDPGMARWLAEWLPLRRTPP